MIATSNVFSVYNNVKLEKLLFDFLLVLRDFYHKFRKNVIGVIFGQIVLLLVSPFIVILLLVMLRLGYKLRKIRRELTLDSVEDYHKARIAYEKMKVYREPFTQLYKHNKRHFGMIWLMDKVAKKMIGSFLALMKSSELAFEELNPGPSAPKGFISLSESDLWVRRNHVASYKF